LGAIALIYMSQNALFSRHEINYLETEPNSAFSDFWAIKPTWFEAMPLKDFDGTLDDRRFAAAWAPRDQKIV
jgi:hypothetical protein